MTAPEEIQEKTGWLRRLACRNAGAGENSENVTEEIQENIVDVAKVSGILVWVK